MVITPNGNISVGIHEGGYWLVYVSLKWLMKSSFVWFSSFSIRRIERLNLDGFEKLLASVIQKELPVISVPKLTIAQRTAISIFSISLNNSRRSFLSNPVNPALVTHKEVTNIHTLLLISNYLFVYLAHFNKNNVSLKIIFLILTDQTIWTKN